MESNIQNPPVKDAEFQPESKDPVTKVQKWLQLPAIRSVPPLLKATGNTLNRLKNKLNLFKDILNRITSWCKAKFGELHFSQWCYFVATVMLIMYLGKTNPDKDWPLVVGVIAGFGLTRELWQVFTGIWEHTFGKGVLLVIYAATANFALATSALQINNVSGIEPQAFVFTMGFTTLIMLPFWLLSASILFLGSAIVIGNIWLLISVLLHIVGIKVKLHWEDKSFAILTMSMRLLLIPFLITVVITIINPYLKQININALQSDLIFYSTSHNTSKEQQALKAMSESEILRLLVLIQNNKSDELTKEETQKINKLGLTGLNWLLIQNASDKDLLNIVAQLKRNGETSRENTNETSTLDEVLTENKAKAENTSKVMSRMIAWFIYRFETYSYSSCIKEKSQRVLSFEQNSMFVAERDKNAEFGYKFYVAVCKTAYNNS